MADIDADLLDDIVAFETTAIGTDVNVSVSDTVAFSELMANVTLAEGSFSDGMEFSADFYIGRVSDGVFSDEILFTSEFFSNGFVNVTLIDTVRVTDSFSPLQPYALGWTLNLDSGAATQYDWPAYNSFASVDGRYYGASEDGIFELDGATDDGASIDWFLMTGASNLDSRLNKQVKRGYLSIRYDGSVYLKTVVGDNEVRVYRLVSDNDSMLQRRLQLGQGVDSVYWQFALESVDGEDFELESIGIFPVVLTRRFR